MSVGSWDVDPQQVGAVLTTTADHIGEEGGSEGLLGHMNTIEEAITGCESAAHSLAFHLIGLEMVWLKVLEPNTAGRNAYAKAGFREVGTIRNAGVWKGMRCGEVVMDALSEDFPWPSVLVDENG